MAISIIDSAAGLEALAAEWDDLWRRTPDATPFQSPHWILPWWRAYGSDTPFAIAVRDSERLSALAPLYVLRDDDSGESLGMLLGTGNSDYLDVLAADGTAVESIAEAMLSADCQMWDLQQLRPSSALRRFPLRGPWSEAIEEQDLCPQLSISGAGDELSGLLSTHARKKLRYYRRSLEKLGAVSYESATAESLSELVEALFALHAARWQQRGLPGVLADEPTQRFHREAAAAMLGAGALRMYALRIDGRIAAVFYGFAHNATFYYYLSGYDPQLERLSIGNVIVAHAIEEAVREGAASFDFLRGAEEYKYSWGAVDRPNSRRQLFRDASVSS